MDRENVGILFSYYQLLLSETLQVNRVKIIRHFERLLFFTMHMYTCVYIYIYNGHNLGNIYFCIQIVY